MKLKSALLKPKYGSEVVLFEYYRNFHIDILTQKYLKSEIIKLDNTNKDSHTSFYDEEIIEDAFGVIRQNGKGKKIIHNYSTKFIF